MTLYTLIYPRSQYLRYFPQIPIFPVDSDRFNEAGVSPYMNHSFCQIKKSIFIDKPIQDLVRSKYWSLYQEARKKNSELMETVLYLFTRVTI